jgi:hypothetical protein
MKTSIGVDSTYALTEPRQRSPRRATIAALSRLVPPEWQTLRWREMPGETIVATHGLVEIRRVPACRMVQTCAKGDAAQSRETGLRRLVSYLNGGNGDGVVLAAFRPITQQQIGARRWLISVGLREAGDGLRAPSPLARKVKVVPLACETIAVVRVSGLPTFDRVAGGDMIVLDAIANSNWVATGAVRIRLRVPGALLRVTGGFEVAVPVVERVRDRTE